QYFPKPLKISKILIVVALLAFSACSTKKNTIVTRSYHNLTSRFNLYFNGKESLKSGIKKVEKTYVEDYSKILPIFTYEDKAVSSMMTSEMDRSIRKCAKTIKMHSITVKPKKNKNKKLSKKELDFYNKTEYCKWIDNTYLLMGVAHFYQMEFETAKLTFLLVLSKYKNEDIIYDAMLWLAKTYVQTNEFDDALKILTDLKKKSQRPEKINHQMDLLYAHMYLKQGEYKKAIPKIRTAIDNEKNKNYKARLIYIIAQIYKKEEKYLEASENFMKVIKLNPNYDMTFSARINLAEISEKIDSKGKDLKKELLKMADDEKNIDYLDQIYYALGKIELDEKNIQKAIEYFSLSANSKSSNKSQKVKTFIVLADYYYGIKDYNKAEAYYDSTSKVMDNTYPDYELLSKNVKSFKGISHNYNVINREDSLIALAKMPENQRNEVINKKIAQIIKEENDKKALEQNAAFDPFLSNQNNTFSENQNQSGLWYFYNQSSLSYGQTEFKRKWGDRELEDNWRRKNKTLQVELSSENEESTETNGENTTNKEAKTNKKSKEYYLKDIPLTDEALKISNKKIEKAYYDNGEIYYKDLAQNENSLKSFRELLEKYPQTELRLEVLYFLYNLSVKSADIGKIDIYKSLIVNEYPQSVYAKIINDPDYLDKENAKTKEANELYKSAYDLYSTQKFEQAILLCDKGLSEIKSNELEANFLFLKAMSNGELGNKEMLKQNLEFIVLNFPKEKISENAKNILDVINSGKLDMDIYLNEMDSAHFYVLIIPKGRVDLNRIKFNFASFNVENYTQLNLEITTDSINQTKDLVIIKGFRNSAKANAYSRLLLSKKENEELRLVPNNQFIISKNNYDIFIKDGDIDKYLKFYSKVYK
ncbi:MAG: hypothetical protein JXA16_07015, partial [Bacteroidales bacterium]|nr:hypothetical protein [Bacteroidales bacterium]